MTVRVTHVMDAARVRAVLTAPGGGVTKDLMRRGYRVHAGAVRRCPVDHGRLRSSLTVAMVTLNGHPVARVGTNVAYAMWVHNGTGIYGPRKTPIVPKNGKFLVFTPRKSNGAFVRTRDRRVVFARSVKGMKGVPFLRDALLAEFGR